MSEVITEEKKPVYKRLPLDEKGELIKRKVWIHSPEDMVIISFPKHGKTRSMMGVNGILIGDADPEQGTKYFKGDNVANIRTAEGTEEFIQIKDGTWVPSGLWYTVDELAKANRIKEYKKLRARLEERISDKEKEAIYKDLLAHLISMPFPVFAVDTTTFMQDLNWAAALVGYNKRFGTKKVNIKEADQFGGSLHIRNNFMGIKNFVDANSAPFKIWTGHLKEKKSVLEKGAEEDVSSVDMALEGQMSTIFTGKAQAVGIFYRNEKGCFLDFRKRGESDNGSRPEHLSNKLVKIADLDEMDKEGKVTKLGNAYWEKIYPELAAKFKQ